MKKLKLKCFRCGAVLEKKEEVFRSAENYPLCETCCEEAIEADGFDDAGDALEIVKTCHGRSYAKYRRYNEERCVVCPKCNYYVEKSSFFEDANMCQTCFENA